MCILFAYTLLKVVSYYDLSVLSMSLMGFQKVWMRVGGWGELYPILFWIFLNFAKPRTPTHNSHADNYTANKVFKCCIFKFFLTNKYMLPLFCWWLAASF